MTRLLPRGPRRTLLRSAIAGPVLLCAAMLGSAAGSPARGVARAPRVAAVAPVQVAGVHCADGGRTEVSLPDGGFDAIRVVVDAAVPGAATDVTLLAGHGDRTVRAFGGGEWGLVLDEPLRERHVQVAVEPVLEAPAGACVARVELLRRGAVVGTARIR
ncbi:MAG: hypothetical protein H6709_24115 [Kofleriaceae bacterium]|nr:hypothetical protein [Kofleriaceae bacterium]MCB9575174.1 hypothetical protein [Kofleriaceae bacterium]